MTTFFAVGTRRLIYRSENYATGLTVTGYIWNPSLTKSGLQTLTEISDGFYYLDWDFSASETWFGKFYENGVAKADGTFRISTLQGTGAVTFTYTLTVAVVGTPIADVDVWVTTDLTGNNVIASGRTNQNGQVVFYVDANTTIYVWSQKTGFNFDNPDTEVIGSS